MSNIPEYPRKTDKKVKTIAGRLVRELQRKLPAESYKTDLELFERLLRQKRQDKNKVYSLHEPEVACISKGKEHKKYEFGSKVSITVTQKSGVIIGALNIPEMITTAIRWMLPWNNSKGSPYINSKKLLPDGATGEEKRYWEPVSIHPKLSAAN